MSEDPFSVTYADSLTMPATTLQGLRMRAGSVAGLTTSTELERRIRDYIHINSLLNVPSTLRGLNRRFGRTARRLGTVTSAVCEALLTSGQITELEHRTMRCYVSTAMWSGRATFVADLGFTEAEEREAVELLLGRAE